MDVTTATPEELKRLYDHIAQQMNDDRFFTTKELHLLPKIMTPNEWLYGFSSGYMNNATWLIVLTSKRVIFLNKNLLWGYEETSIGLGKINSVPTKAGIFLGSITLHDGSREYSIRNVWKKSIIPFTNRLQQAIDEFDSAARTGIPIPAPRYPWDAVAPQDGTSSSETSRDPTPPPPAPPSPPEAADREIRMPDAPVSGPLRAYLDSLPDETPPAQPRRPAPAPVAQPAPAAPHVSGRSDLSASKSRLDRLRRAGAIDDAEYDRQMQGIMK